MKITIAMLLLAGFMPLMCAAIAKWGFKGYDNHHPRQWQQSLTGWRARADAAQANSLEAFPFFAVAVGVAVWAQVSEPLVSGISVMFVLARLVYVWCYVSDRATLRSSVWLLGYGCVLALMALALLA